LSTIIKVIFDLIYIRSAFHKVQWQHFRCGGQDQNRLRKISSKFYLRKIIFCSTCLIIDGVILHIQVGRFFATFPGRSVAV